MPVTKTFRIALYALIGVMTMFLLIGCTVMPDEGSPQPDGTLEPQLPQPKTITDPVQLEINSAIQKAAASRQDVLAFIVFRVSIDNVKFSKDGDLALVWISMVDKQTGLVQSGEPGLVIAHKTGDPSQPWRVIFQADPTFTDELMALPEDMISMDDKVRYLPAVQQESKDGVVYRGYKLPWTKGQTVNLTGSIGHVFTYKSCPSTCLYAFDFANGTMFAIKAAKAGMVRYVQWTHPNGNTTSPNYIVLEDPTTTPTTYQVYYHLAQNTIPPELRVVGTWVTQGQFIGNVDDTGYSTGNHLHFHVHTTPYSVWGNSVDIVFDEVPFNGGRPRTCSEASAYPEYGTGCSEGNRYVSQNGDAATPTGAITSPAAYSTITAPTLNVSGWMQDDTAVEKGQLMYNTGGDWTPIGLPVTTSPFTREINVCDTRIPDGKVFLSLVVTDKAGKTSTGTQGLTELNKVYTCPPLPPACSPAENQVALYTDTEYQGTCQVVDIGEVANLGSLATPFLDNLKSIQVGSGVSALLYPDADFAGTFEFLQDGDSNLADNLIGSMNAASMKVVSRINPPQPPNLILPDAIHTGADLTLNWAFTEGEQTRSTLSGPNDYLQSVDWQTGGAWQVGRLAEGTYTWMVEARNLAGIASTIQEFEVAPQAMLPLSHLNPMPELINSSVAMLTWEVDEGADGIDHFELQYRNPGGEWIDTPAIAGKSTRQTLFWGTPGAAFEFRLRAVDILGNAEEYLSVSETKTQLVETCLEDPFEGTPPGDDDIATAAVIEEGVSQTHNWCQAGDTDWLKFSAVAGDELQFSTQALDNGSAAVLTLFETDGSTFIGEARPFNHGASATLDWTAPFDGTYYLKLTPVDGRITGTESQYEVGVELKSQLQPGTLVCGSVAVPALIAAGYAVTKQVKKEQKRKERKTLLGR